jgi:hypothetical protein
MAMEERIKHSEHGVSSRDVHSEKDIEAISSLPLDKNSMIRRVLRSLYGWILLLGLVLAIYLAFLVVSRFDLAEILFWPILAVILYLFLWLIGSFIPTVQLRIDRRQIVYGGLGFRKSRPFSDVVAVQLLQVVDLKKRKGVDTNTYEVNIVLNDEGQNRLHFVSHKDVEIAKNYAQSYANLFQAPVVEQIYLPGSN